MDKLLQNAYYIYILDYISDLVNAGIKPYRVLQYWKGEREREREVTLVAEERRRRDDQRLLW